jgi:hypothetical protein
MKIKTNELTGDALDWAVATIYPQLKGLKLSVVAGVMCGIDPEDGVICIYMAEGIINRMRLRLKPEFSCAIAFNPSTDWSQGGLIIEREFIEFGVSKTDPVRYAAKIYVNDKRIIAHGSTHLIAAMRCYVASKLGDDVEIPEELAQ